MTDTTRRPQSEETEILVVEDERNLADAFAEWLNDEYAVLTAYTGEEALEMVDSDTDIVLLDRRLPGRSGDEVLGEIRARGLDCRVAMVSAVDPSEKMLKLDIDEYVTKPVTSEELRALVEEMERRHALESEMQRYTALISKKQTIESERSLDALLSNTRYQEVLAELTKRREELTETLARQAEHRTRPEHHYSLRQVIAGVVSIGLVAVFLVVVHNLVPDGAQRLARTTDPDNPLAAYPASVFHLSDAHLYGNVGGFLFVALLTYMLCLRMVVARWFYLTAIALVTVVPLSTHLVVSGPIAAVAGDVPLLVGFSGVVSAFVGFSFLAFLAVLRLVYEPRSVVLVGGFTLFSAASVLLWLNNFDPFVPATVSLVLFAAFASEQFIRQTGDSRKLGAVARNILAAGLVGGLYAGLSIGIVPQSEFGAVYSGLGHAVGLGSGFVIALLVALLVNVFPIRESVRQKGYPLPDRLI